MSRFGRSWSSDGEAGDPPSDRSPPVDGSVALQPHLDPNRDPLAPQVGMYDVGGLRYATEDTLDAEMGTISAGR